MGCTSSQPEKEQPKTDKASNRSKSAKSRGSTAKSKGTSGRSTKDVSSKAYTKLAKRPQKIQKHINKPDKELVSVVGPKEKVDKRHMRVRLRDATRSNDIDELEAALSKFEKNKLPDNGDLTNGKERLQFLKLRKGLRDAIMRRYAHVLEDAIENATNSTYANDLESLIERARDVRDHLLTLDQFGHDVLAMEQKTISELRSYIRPASSVHEVMAATYLLLGVPEENLVDWAGIQMLLNRVGGDRLKNRISRFDTVNVDPANHIRAKQLLRDYTLNDIRTVSNGAATFYIWAQNVVDIMDCQQSERDKQHSPEHRNNKTRTR